MRKILVPLAAAGVAAAILVFGEGAASAAEPLGRTLLGRT